MRDSLKIAVASGKGGTGKTTVAVCLALTAAASGGTVQYLDCDVEEPNGHIFLKPHLDVGIAATVPIPEVIADRCNGCGRCADVCEYNAIAVVKGEVLIFPELCHSCGACRLFCREEAIVDANRSVGTIESGSAEGGLFFIRGVLDIGQIASPAVIAAVKEAAGGAAISFIDCPPGTSCPVIEAVKDADLVLLVTESTPFGLHDLTLAVEMTRALDIPFAVILNRCDLGTDNVETYCMREGIPIVLSIPDDRRIAQAYAEGQSVFAVLPSYKVLFAEGWERIIALKNETAFQRPQCNRTAQQEAATP
jgi:MinD superfamily P-loop ATPase